MSSSAPAVSTTSSNFIQRNLIPEDSHYVRYVMQKAAHFGTHDNLLIAHGVSVAFAVLAVALSVFNAISYLLQTPVKILLNIVQFNPIGLVAHPVIDISSCLKSLLFVSLGVTFVVAGFLFPAALFTHFSPEYYEPLEVRLEQKLKVAEDENANLKAKVKHLDDLNRTLILQSPTPKRFFGLF